MSCPSNTCKTSEKTFFVELKFSYPAGKNEIIVMICAFYRDQIGVKAFCNNPFNSRFYYRHYHTTCMVISRTHREELLVQTEWDQKSFTGIPRLDRIFST